MNAAASSVRPAAAGSTMTGSIAEVALPDLLQLFSASKKTGVLQISTATDVGSMYLDEGRVRFAVVNGDESVPPEKAFYRILVWDTGTFDLLPEAEREFPSEIQSSIEGLLMEGMRQLARDSSVSEIRFPRYRQRSTSRPRSRSRFATRRRKSSTSSSLRSTTRRSST